MAQWQGALPYKLLKRRSREINRHATDHTYIREILLKLRSRLLNRRRDTASP